MADVLCSELLRREGFAHGFSLRTGGVSTGPFASLNLGRRVGDDPEAVADNHARFARAAGFEPGRLFEVSQVHGARVVRVAEEASVEAVRGEQADALVTAVPGAAVGVRVADCLPVLMGDGRTGAVAAVHAGWRGAVAGVVSEAVAALGRWAGTGPADLWVALGPHIRVGAFEVGEDVASELAAAAPGREVVERGEGKPHVDLAGVVRAQLRVAGVPDAHVDDVGGCTFTEPARFFSYRRDGSRSGRHLGAIRVREPG